MLKAPNAADGPHKQLNRRCIDSASFGPERRLHGYILTSDKFHSFNVCDDARGGLFYTRKVHLLSAVHVDCTILAVEASGGCVCL